MKKLLLLLSFVLAIFIHVDSAYAVDYPFSVTTTSTDRFEFMLSAQGTFYVDCGDGGTLDADGNGVNGGIITKSDTNQSIYHCNYSTTGVRTIRFGGTATAYNTDSYTPAIYFQCEYYSDGVISAISGNLSTLFPYLGAGDGQQPSFSNTFGGCFNLTSIPENLFGGYTTGPDYMFNETFSGCSGLTSIPAGLFRNITTASDWMFNRTFKDCTGLTSIPATLFSGITTGTEGLFAETFYGTGLISIPGNLFSGITNSADYMFNYTFSSCTGLTSIPAKLFKNITTGAMYLYGGTFDSCTGVTSIPEDLFKNITTGAIMMFSGTFASCTGLTSIPENLFSGITTSALMMFFHTFDGCTNIAGYIPPSTFAGLIANGHPTATNMWGGTFENTQLVTSCPSGYRQYGTGYEGTTSGTTWNGYVSCQPNLYYCRSGYYLPANSAGTCAACPSGYTCDGGYFQFDPVNDQGLGINRVNLSWDDGEYSTPASCTVGGIFLPPTPEPRPGYIFTGWKAKAKPTCSLTGVDASIGFSAYGYQNDRTSYISDDQYGANNYNTETFGITTDNTWAVQFSYGTVWGEAACSGNADSSSSMCVCRVKYFQPTGGERCTVSPNPWVEGIIKYRDYSKPKQTAVSKCTYDCVYTCTISVMGSASRRAGAFGQ